MEAKPASGLPRYIQFEDYLHQYRTHVLGTLLLRYANYNQGGVFLSKIPFLMSLVIKT